MNPTSQSYVMPVVRSYLSLLAQWRNDENFTEHHLVTCWITKEFVNNTVINLLLKLLFHGAEMKSWTRKLSPEYFKVADPNTISVIS